MEQSVTIKGTKSGIILVLDPVMPFENLCKVIADKFNEASSFFGKKNMGLIIRGREVSDDEGSIIIDIIQKSSDLTIFCLVDEESGEEKLFERSITGHLKDDIPSLKTQDEALELQVNPEEDALIFRGNLRSGQDISSEKSIIVLGDVKPGANVTSYGSIFILGELRGNAFAGALGDSNAVIMALDLNPLQVRIADAIAISPEAEKGPKLKTRRKKFMGPDHEPEIAYIENGHIVKSLYGASFLRQFFKI